MPLVSAAAVGWRGLIACFDPRDATSPCYACVFGEDDETLGDCASAGVFGPLAGVIGTLAASEAAKLATGTGHALVGRLLRFDAGEGRFAESRMVRDPHCKTCEAR